MSIIGSSLANAKANLLFRLVFVKASPLTQECSSDREYFAMAYRDSEHDAMQKESEKIPFLLSRHNGNRNFTKGTHSSFKEFLIARPFMTSGYISRSAEKNATTTGPARNPTGPK